MSSFSLSGGVQVFGFISPSDTTDQYPVIDPLYGIDGLRNVNTLLDLNNIPTLRRRAGMIVGISGGTTYYKLNPPPWNNTITDWSIFNSGGVSGNYLALSGGTVTGETEFTNGLSANTISATTYLNLPLDIFVTGGTYSAGTATFTNNSGGTFNVNGFYTGETSYVNTLTTGTGLSANTTNGNITIINTDPDQVVTISGGTGIITGGTYPNFEIINSLPDQTVILNNGTNINVSGTYPNFTIDVTGITDNDIYITGFTYSANTITIFQNSGSSFSLTINEMTGLTINGDFSVTNTSILNNITSLSLSGNTNRLVEVNSGGTLTANTEIIEAYISSASTVATQLSNISNWDINGNYIGTAITGTFQGQKYYDNNYFFEAVQNNVFIRLIRG